LKTGKNPRENRFTQRMQRRLEIIFGIVCVLFLVMVGKIILIQTKSGQKYEKIVLAQQEYSSTTIPFQRGNILDAQGTALASSIDVYNVVLDCKALNQSDQLIKSTEEVVEQCFPEVDIADFEKRLKKNPKSQYQVLAKKVSYSEKQAFDEESEKRAKDKTKGNEVAGIWLEKQYDRQYPYGSMAASAIGFTTSGNEGVTGLEMYYNDELNGMDGRSYGYVNDDSDVEKTVVDAKSGNSIQTTIDHNIQKIVEDAITNENAAHIDATHPRGSLHTSCVVMNPNTGSILAIADYPTYDLNNPRDLSGLYTADQLSAMTDDDKLSALNTLWNSSVVTHTYEPGSTFKPFTVAAGLDSGTLKGDETFVCPGYKEFPGDIKVHCWKTEGHGVETVEGALRDSCDVALMDIGEKVGAENFHYYQRLFGFGQKTGVDLPGEAYTATLLYDTDSLMKPINLETNAFGQNFNVTMIQMASAFCSVINGGKYYKPHIVTSIIDSDGNTVKNIDPVVMKQTVSEDTSKTIRTYLRSVVTEGTGTPAAVEGYDIGGKTGTAEKLPRTDKNYVLSFEGFAPVDDPQVMVYVTVDTVNAENQYHDTIAKQIAHDIFAQILPYMNIPTIAATDAANGSTAAQTAPAQ
jgi:stage V sporulation protein D (sporulation-specific penicillin-binding protein)